MNKLFPNFRRRTRSEIDQIRDLKGLIEVLEAKENHLERQCHEQYEQAKNCVTANDRNGALMHLRSKRQLETALERVMGQRMTLEMQTLVLESSYEVSKLVIPAIDLGVLLAHVDDNINDNINHTTQEFSHSTQTIDIDDDLAAELAELENSMNRAVLLHPLVIQNNWRPSDRSEQQAIADAELADLEASMNN
mmetsp:Transcript_20435/g.28655  ORF Transcript_20435/g.28655 Transcript_20435/m.28655 type:complete len:193 (-) Transcript_20435:218-796(-)